MSSASPDLSRINNFDAVRVAAALAVIVGHGFILTGNGDAPRVLGVAVHTLGVAVFFVMSGYLISQSWFRRPIIVDYLRNRALRVLPALLIVTVVSFAILGPLFSRLSLAEYFTHEGSWRYLWNAGLRPVFALPGVFETVPYARSVNGSLWTLPIEFACYLLIPLVLSLPRRFHVAALLVLALGGSFAYFSVPLDFVVYGTSIRQAAGLWVFFAGGALCGYLLNQGLVRLDLAVVLLAGQLVLSGATNDPGVLRIGLWLVLPYVVIAFATLATPGLRRAARFGDLSYGLYLFAFPVQQIVVQLAPDLPLLMSIGVVASCTGLLAFASWHLVEKRALALKSHRTASRSPDGRIEDTTAKRSGVR